MISSGNSTVNQEIYPGAAHILRNLMARNKNGFHNLITLVHR
jgi:hypothetical protein